MYKLLYKLRNFSKSTKPALLSIDLPLPPLLTGGILPPFCWLLSLFEKVPFAGGGNQRKQDKCLVGQSFVIEKQCEIINKNT